MVNVGGGKKSSVVSGLHYRLFYALYLYENSCMSSHSMLQETMANRTGQQSIIRYRYGLFHFQVQVWSVSLTDTGSVCFIVRYSYSLFLCQIQVKSVPGLSSLAHTMQSCLHTSPVSPTHQTILSCTPPLVSPTHQTVLTHSQPSLTHHQPSLTHSPALYYPHISPVSPTHPPIHTYSLAHSHLTSPFSHTHQPVHTYSPAHSHLFTSPVSPTHQPIHTYSPAHSHLLTSPFTHTHQPILTYSPAQSHLLTSLVAPLCKFCLTWKFELHVLCVR